MNVKFIKNNKLLEVSNCSKIELEMLNKIASGTTKKWIKTKQGKSKIVDDDINFLFNYRYLPSGLWKRVLMLKNSNYNVNFTNLHKFVRTNINEEEFNKWIDSIPLKFKTLRWYQSKAVLQALKFPQSTLELAPAAGKTLIIYLIARYLLENILDNQKVLIVVPRTLLVKQMPKDFDDYSYDKPIRCSEIFSVRNEHKDDNVVIGTMQTLVNCEDKEWFSQFGAIIIDECHQSQTKTICSILDKMPNETTYQITGLSGTFYNPKSKEGTIVEAYMGGTVMKVSHKDLETAHYVPHVNINIIECKFSIDDTNKLKTLLPKGENKVIYLDEVRYLNAHPKRTRLLVDIVNKINKNQLLLFRSKDDCYSTADVFRKYTNKKVYEITGDVPLETRIKYLNDMETRDDIVLCAMYQTMSTGVSIKRVHVLHLIDSTKSFIDVRQAIGRICRQFKGKEEVYVYDWGAVFPFSEGISSSERQIKSRIKIYKEQEYDYKISKININEIKSGIERELD